MYWVLKGKHKMVDRQLQRHETPALPELPFEEAARNLPRPDTLIKPAQDCCFSPGSGFLLPQGLSVSTAANALRTASGEKKYFRNILSQPQETIRGLIRENLIGGLYVVCDGVSLAVDGEIASFLATWVVTTEVAALIANSNLSFEQVLQMALIKADQAIQDYSLNSLPSDSRIDTFSDIPQNCRTGTTISAALLDPEGNAFLASVGDSRTFIDDGQSLTSVFNDDSTAFYPPPNSTPAGIPVWYPGVDRLDSYITKVFGFGIREEDIQTVTINADKWKHIFFLTDGVFQALPLISNLPGDPIAVIMNGLDEGFKSERSKLSPGNIPELHQLMRRYIGKLFRELLLKDVSINDSGAEELAGHLINEETPELSNDDSCGIVLKKK
jgi:serine/threonine protein phosphatase PrpC